MWIWICGPYASNGASENERAKNMQRLNHAARAVFKLGHTPLVGINMALPMATEEDSTSEFNAIRRRLSAELLEKCDACLRVPGESEGADQETAIFESSGRPIFTEINEIPG